MTDRPQLLSWLRQSLIDALARQTLVWEQPHQAKYKHAKLESGAQAAICGRYATLWKTPKARIRHCDICLDLIEQAGGGWLGGLQISPGDTKTTDSPIVLSDKPGRG